MQIFIRFFLQALLIVSLFMPKSAFATTISLPRTGQTTCTNANGAVIVCAGTGQDGDKMIGVAWSAATRFTDNGNGTVTDNLTGLVWLKHANCFGWQAWSAALTSSNALVSGVCGLTDSSTAGQWRLPNITELESLLDLERIYPALPIGHPFTSVQSPWQYWSSSSFAGVTTYAWGVNISDGRTETYDKAYDAGVYVWPVRAGQ